MCAAVRGMRRPFLRNPQNLARMQRSTAGLFTSCAARLAQKSAGYEYSYRVLRNLALTIDSFAGIGLDTVQVSRVHEGRNRRDPYPSSSLTPPIRNPETRTRVSWIPGDPCSVVHHIPSSGGDGGTCPPRPAALRVGNPRMMVLQTSASPLGCVDCLSDQAAEVH